VATPVTSDKLTDPEVSSVSSPIWNLIQKRQNI
jgi:hypothetical protein